jgi:hypothetical protein
MLLYVHGMLQGSSVPVSDVCMEIVHCAEPIPDFMILQLFKHMDTRYRNPNAHLRALEALRCLLQHVESRKATLRFGGLIRVGALLSAYDGSTDTDGLAVQEACVLLFSELCSCPDFYEELTDILELTTSDVVGFGLIVEQVVRTIYVRSDSESIHQHFIGLIAFVAKQYNYLIQQEVMRQPFALLNCVGFVMDMFCNSVIIQRSAINLLAYISGDDYNEFAKSLRAGFLTELHWLNRVVYAMSLHRDGELHHSGCSFVIKQFSKAELQTPLGCKDAANAAVDFMVRVRFAGLIYSCHLRLFVTWHYLFR